MNEEYYPQRFVCCDCDGEFVWTAAEQDYYRSQNFPAPKRCKYCRALRRAERTAAWPPMVGVRPMAKGD